jgi:hypothetical protein
MKTTNRQVVSITTTVRPLGRSLVMLALCVGLFAARANAADLVLAESAADSSACRFCNGIRVEDEIALVNVRRLCGSCDPESLRTGIAVENYAVTNEAGQRRWRKSDLESFLAFDPSVTTVFYIHGNQMTNWDAKCQGLALYRKLANYGCGDRPIRFVIFSWPSAKVSGLLNDVRVKAMRTGPAGCQLAWLIDQMQPETPVSLIGFSFGARIITAGLHVLGGGDLGCGLTLEHRANADRAPINAVLIAAAVHAHWLGDGQHHGLAMTQVNRMFLLNNCRDLALRYYHLTTTNHSRPQALGICGPTNISRENAAKIRMRDVSSTAGSEHDLFMYLCAAGATGQVWDYAVNMQAAAEPQVAN